MKRQRKDNVEKKFKKENPCIHRYDIKKFPEVNEEMNVNVKKVHCIPTTNQQTNNSDWGKEWFKHTTTKLKHGKTQGL